MNVDSYAFRPLHVCNRKEQARLTRATATGSMTATTTTDMTAGARPLRTTCDMPVVTAGRPRRVSPASETVPTRPLLTWSPDKAPNSASTTSTTKSPKTTSAYISPLSPPPISHSPLTCPSQGLFSRKGPLISLHLQYDRSDRSTGTAFATYADPRDARDAVEDFDGQHAHGQPIRVAIVPTGPRGGGDSYGGGGGRDGGAAASAGRSLFDRMEKPSRSMFDRMEQPRDSRRRDRSDSPRKPAPAGTLNVDRYVPGPRDSRSPIRRRGTPREPGRRPGARRDDSSRGGGAAGRGGRREGGPRPKKTQEELDREMEDYWGSTTMEGHGEAANGGGETAGAADDTDMVL